MDGGIWWSLWGVPSAHKMLEAHANPRGSGYALARGYYRLCLQHKKTIHASPKLTHGLMRCGKVLPTGEGLPQIKHRHT